MLTLWLGAALAFLVTPKFGAAADSLVVRVGFDRGFKVGQWTPIVVEGADPSARACEVIVVDPDGVRVVQPLAKPSAGAAPFWSGVFRSGRLDGDVEVRVLGDGTEPVQRGKLLAQQSRNNLDVSEVQPCFPMRQSQPMWLEVGTATELLKSVETVFAVRSKNCPEASEIPWALDGVDGMWVTSRTSLSEPARIEVERWLRRGGLLVVTVATSLDEFQRTPWAVLLKDVVELSERTRTSDLSGIETFAVHSRKILGATRTPVTIVSPKEGRVLISSLDGPLVTRASFGFGQVTVLGIDPTAMPLVKWEGRTAFVRRLLGQVTDKEVSKSGVRALSQTGITDLASQWRAAVIDMPEIARPSLWEALGLLLAFAVVIGPLDYLLVHKLLKRPHWTWGTLPLLVSVASIGVVWLAHAANGHAVKLTQLDVMDIAADRQEVTARSWVTTYSNENSVWRIEAAPTRLNAAVETTPPNNASKPAITLSWLGFPENASGGMYRDSGFDLGRSVFHSAADRSSLNGLPLAQWSSKSLTSEAIWVSETPLVESQLSSTVAGELSGSFVHHLPFELHDWIVVFDKWVYRPHPKVGAAAIKWPADDPWTPGDSRNYGRELRGFLTRTTVTKRQAKKGVIQEDVLSEQERYRPMNLDPAEILQMLTLHAAAGGKAYTGLDHHSLRAFDVSPLLSLDRAVVIARVAEPTTTWRFNGQVRERTRHHGFVRFLLPVQRNEGASNFRVLPKYEPVPAAPTETTPTPNDSAPKETKTP